MRTVLVTGASGFVGVALTRRLSEAGWIVRAAARNLVSVPTGERIFPVPLPDLTGTVDWAPLVAGADSVVHLAGIAHRGGTEDGLYDRAIRVATAGLVEACRGRGVSRLIFVSSIGAQTGSAAEHVVTEQDRPYPETPYDRAKLAAEAVVRDAGVAYTILRPVLVYGPGVKGNMALLMRIASLPCPLPFGAFENRRSLLALDNLNDAIVFCLENQSTRNDLFIVADDTPVSLAEMFASLRAASGRNPGLVSVPPALVRVVLLALGRRALWERIGGSLIADVGKLKSRGWSPRVGTKAGLRAMIAR